MKSVCMILKAPRVGTVKTRLAQDIGPECATAIYRALVEWQAKAIPAGWDAAIYFTPLEAAEEMQTWLRPHLPCGTRFVAQCKGDLGQRLTAAVHAEFQRSKMRLFLIGGDCPGISRNYLIDADGRLNESDVVVGPATDGGYVLLGLKDPHVVLFENIAWSTRAVLDQTLVAARRQFLSVALLPTLEDIDDIASLQRQSRFPCVRELITKK
jgi:uncharacterized protein